MPSLSKIHGKCKDCKHKDSCTNKKMVACIADTTVENNTQCISRDNTEYRSQPAHLKCTPITINMGEYGNINTTIEEIKKQLKKDSEKELRLGIYNCIR